MKNKKAGTVITYILIIIMIISLALSFNVIAKPVAEWTGTAVDTVTDLARTVFFTAVGLYLITSGVAALAAPIVGVALIVIGIVLVAYAVWPWLTSDDKPEKPDNVKL